MHSSHTASSTIRLSNELWIVVLELLYEDGCHHLLAVSRTCSWLDQLAKPLIFGNIVIDRNAWTEHRYESLLKRHTNLAKHTSSIEVRKGADSNDFVPISEKYLPEIVGICSKLQDFTWNGDYALLPPVHQYIVNRKIRLHYTSRGSFELLAHLENLPYHNVRTLDLHIDKFFVDNESQRYFEKIVKTMEKCIHLDKLSLAMVPGVTPAVDSHMFEEQYHLPPLRDITLQSYSWPEEYEANHNYWNFSRIERLVLIDMPIRNFLVNSSFATSDLSHLTRLVLGDLVGGYLQSMQADNTNFMLMTDAAREVWKRAVNLQSLSIPKGWRSFLPSQDFGLLNLNLRELNLLLRERRCDGALWTEPVNDTLDLEDLSALHFACPRLRSLHFATRLSGQWAVLPDDLVSAVSQFKQLRELRIEDDEFLGHDLAYGRWVNIPSKRDGARIAKKLMISLMDATTGLKLETIVVVTSGRYSKNEDYDHMYFRKYETNGRYFGHAETIEYEIEPAIVLNEDLRPDPIL